MDMVRSDETRRIKYYNSFTFARWQACVVYRYVGAVDVFSIPISYRIQPPFSRDRIRTHHRLTSCLDRDSWSVCLRAVACLAHATLEPRRLEYADWRSAAEVEWHRRRRRLSSQFNNRGGVRRCSLDRQSPWRSILDR